MSGEWDPPMAEALEQARGAVGHGDVPVGAVVMRRGTIIAARHNERQLTGDPTAHAELLAMRDASRALGSWRLDDCTVVVTLEPCAMCAGALVNARVPTLVYGARDPKAGAVHSLYTIPTDARLNHRLSVVADVMAAESAALLRAFFAERRAGYRPGIMSERVEVRGDDVTLVADAYGAEGAPGVLLAHGGGQTRHSWGATARRLGESGYRAVTVDLRGHGDSSWSPAGRYDLADHAGDLRDVARWMGAPPAFVGASLGGLSSLVAITEAPIQTTVASALVLVDVAIHLEADGVARIGQFMRARPDGFASLEEVADAVAAYNPHRPRPNDLSGLRKNVRQGDDGRWRWHWDPRIMRDPKVDEPRTVLHRQRLERDASSLQVPTLLVRGRNSDLLSERGAKRFLDLVPHAEFVDVAGAGHMVAGDRNDAFNEGIIDFLHRVRPVARGTMER